MTDSTPLTYTEALQQTPLPTRLNRAKHHYTTRLQQLQSDSAQLSQLHASYQKLSEQLLSLPRRLRAVQRVPFGPLASFSGRLVHTNEWLVLLGGEWWLECTADRARRIAKDRLTEVERRQGRVRDEEKRVREWMEEGDRVMGEAGGGRTEEAEGEGEQDNIVEIKEEYREDEEADMAGEDKREGRSAERSGVNSRAESVKAAGGMTDAEFDSYWDKLAELEEEEERKGSGQAKSEQKQTRSTATRHTAHDRDAVAERSAEDAPVALPAIRSPADIYKHMQQAAAALQKQQPTQAATTQPAASRQKRVSFSSAQPSVAIIDPVSTRPARLHTHSPPPPGASLLSAAASADVPPPSSNAALAGAFSGAVLERDVDGAESVMQQPAVVKKKMSRFMAERLGLNVDDD